MNITYDKISLIDLDSDIKLREHEIKNAFAELHKIRGVLRKRLAHVEYALAPSTIAEYIEGDFEEHKLDDNIKLDDIEDFIVEGDIVGCTFRRDANDVIDDLDT